MYVRIIFNACSVSDSVYQVLLAVPHSLQSFRMMDHLVSKLGVTLLSMGKTDSIFSMP